MDEFDSLKNEEEKVEYLKKLLLPVAASTGGKIRYVQGEEEVHYTGKYEGRSIRVIMDSSTGGLKVELKIKNTLGTFDINYDPGALQNDGEPDPEWDCGEERFFFIAPGYYIAGDAAYLEEQIKLMESIDRPELEKVMQLMKRLGIGWINTGSSLMRCGLFESLFDADEILTIVQVLHGFAAQFEKDGEQVTARPVVVLGGMAVNPELVAEIMFCPYCNSNVTLGKNRKCPNCGAGL